MWSKVNTFMCYSTSLYYSVNNNYFIKTIHDSKHDKNLV